MPRPTASRPDRSGAAAGSPAAALPSQIQREVQRTTRPTDQREALSRLARAIELVRREDHRAAVVEAQRAKAAAPRSSSVREVLGLALYGAERWSEALAELTAYKRLSGSVDQNHLMADCLRALGKPDRAVPLAEEELHDRQISGEARAEAVIVAASALADQGKFPEALAFLARARTRDDVSEPFTLRLWYVRGDILERAGRSQDAAAEFRKIVRHEPAAFDAAERLAALAG